MPTIRIDSFKGINNKAYQDKMPDGYLRECVNAHADNFGMITRRNGYSQKSADVFSAIWSDETRCFAVKNGDLVEVQYDYTFTTIRAGVGYADMAFTECNGDYYYCSRLVTGIITASGIKTFGMQQVPTQPTLSQASGLLLGGTYLVAITMLDSSGMESGTKDPQSIVRYDNSSIELSSIFVSTDPRVTDIAIYCSERNGAELYRIGTVSNGTTTYTITATNIYGFPLSPALIGANPAPTGEIIAYHYGHLFIANKNFLFYSDGWRYERWRPHNHYRYPSNITCVLPVESGLWIGTEEDGLFYISGKTPKQGKEIQGDFNQLKKHTACLKRNSAQRIEAEFIGNGNPTYGYMAAANEGLFLLLDNGQFSNISQDNLNIPTFETCGSAIMNDSDSYKYVAFVSGASVPTRSI